MANRLLGRGLDILILALAGAGLFLLVRQVRSAPQDHRPTPAQVEVRLLGSTPRPLRARTLQGDTLLAFGSAGIDLVVLFRSDCPACRVTALTWADLADEAAPEARFVALTAEPPETRHEIMADRFEVWHALSAEALMASFPSPVVPVTLAVDERGVVTYARLGILSVEDRDSLVAMLR